MRALEIVVTLVVQGPTLPAVVRWARYPADSGEDAGRRLAERTATEAAIEAIESLRHAHTVDDLVLLRVQTQLDVEEVRLAGVVDEE